MAPPTSWCLSTLLFATAVWADYYVDNANTSVVYSMAPSSSGTAWQTFSVSTQVLSLQISNSTGNYTIPIDASHCYDDNYALGVCGDGDNCSVQFPFSGSGITMYVFSAGFTGMTASFSVDNAPPISKTVAAPPGPDFQVSNVSMYDQQNIPSGNHTMVMTVLDWNGSATSMKFDYAYVNETFVATPSTSTSSSMTQTSSTSQTASGSPTTTSSKSNKIDLGGVIGGTLAGIAFLVAVVVGILYLRRRKQASPPVREDAYQATPFMSEHSTSPPPPATYGNIFGPNLGAGTTIQPLARTAILRDALAAGSQQSSSDPSSRSIMSGTSSNVLQPLRRQPSLGFSTGDRASGLYPDTSSPFTDSAGESRYNFTAEQIEVIDRLRADGVPQETIARVAENFIGKHGNQSSADMSGGGLMRGASIFSAAPPPSYQTNR